MKKLPFLLTVLLASVLLAQSKTILTSFYPIYIMTINITDGVPGVKVVNLTKPQTGCLHDYQLTPQDMKTISTASMFIVNGGGMESFLNKTIKQYPKLRIIEASKGVPLIKDSHGHTNPHLWVSVSGAINEVRNISNELAAADPANSDSYKKNGEAYIKKLEDLKAKFNDAVNSFSNKKIITFHEAFPYFAKEFNLDIVDIIEREPGSEPSAGELASTVRIVRKNGIKALFAEPQYPAKSAETIAKETGATVYILDPAVSGDMDKDAYVRAMEKNLTVLIKALK
ncbi:MAG: zinc ABC transporter substrate-binding protein [Fibrobacteres bacterium]|nr:zinc ABC transporter substrate-binding protein [Fibrobacterota bacterium]